MANPQRVPDPRLDDPINPVPPAGPGPLDERLTPAGPEESRIDNRTVVTERKSGSGVLIAAVVLVLAVIAYFLFAPGTENTPVPADQPATTSEPAAPAPDATAPATPAPDATTPAPAPDATAPATPAPSETAPATPPADSTAPAPESSAPAQPAPAEPAPAQPAPAPAQ